MISAVPLPPPYTTRTRHAVVSPPTVVIGSPTAMSSTASPLKSVKRVAPVFWATRAARSSTRATTTAVEVCVPSVPRQGPWDDWLVRPTSVPPERTGPPASPMQAATPPSPVTFTEAPAAESTVRTPVCSSFGAHTVSVRPSPAKVSSSR